MRKTKNSVAYHEISLKKDVDEKNLLIWIMSILIAKGIKTPVTVEITTPSKTSKQYISEIKQDKNFVPNMFPIYTDDAFKQSDMLF